MTDDDVRDFLAALDDPRATALAELCVTIRGADPRITGVVKWNAPSFLITEHFATTGLERRAGLRLVLHTGAARRPDAPAVRVDDPEGLLDWRAPDRAVLVFADVEEVLARREAVRAVLRQWIAATQ